MTPQRRLRAARLVEAILENSTSDDDYDKLVDWGMEEGSAVEVWGNEELRSKIVTILAAGGTVKPFTVEPAESGYSRSTNPGARGDYGSMSQMKQALGDAYVAGMEDDGFPPDPEMLRRALLKVHRWLRQGYHVIGYCDNIDQAEIIVAKEATDDAGSTDINDQIIKLYRQAKSSPEPQKSELMSRVDALRKRLK